MVSLLCQCSWHGDGRDKPLNRSESVPVDNGEVQFFPAATLAVTPGQVSASAPQSGNLVSVSRSDSSHRALPVPARLASGLRPTGRLRPAMPKLGPMKLLPGTSCEAAYSVCRAPKSASVASTRVAADITASPNLRPVRPCRLGCE